MTLGVRRKQNDIANEAKKTPLVRMKQLRYVEAWYPPPGSRNEINTTRKMIPQKRFPNMAASRRMDTTAVAVDKVSSMPY